MFKVCDNDTGTTSLEVVVACLLYTLNRYLPKGHIIDSLNVTDKNIFKFQQGSIMWDKSIQEWTK